MRFRVLILTVLVMACVLRLQASPQPNDPRIILNGTHDPLGPFTLIMGLDFTFMADASGGGMLSFTNDSGEDWTSLEIEAPAPLPTDVITCGGTSFATCTVLFESSGFAIIDFSGGPGILNGENFTIDLGPSGWPPNGQFRAFANVPEPGTLALFIIGLGPLFGAPLYRFGMRDR
jgi:hypothetical protein